MHALERFKQYLVCGFFIIRSDHNSLKYFLSQTDLSEKQQRWVSKLQSFDFEIQYVKGKNTTTDALSKNPSFYSLSSITGDWKKAVMDEYAQDEFVFGVLSGVVKNKRYVVKEGLILKRNRIFLTPTSEVRKKVLHAFHNIPLVRHPGITKTYQEVRERFTWKGLKRDILRHVQECTQCQRIRSIRGLEDYYIHCPFLSRIGKISPWTSLPAYLRPKARTISW